MAGAADVTNIVSAQQNPTATAPNEVAVGTVIKAVYVEIWLLATSQQPCTVTIMVMKNTSGVNIDATQFQDLNGYNNKNEILEIHQGLIGDANTNPVPFFRGWIKIPKGKQRFALGDAMQLCIKAITEDVQWCGIHIFKAYN